MTIFGIYWGKCIMKFNSTFRFLLFKAVPSSQILNHHVTPKGSGGFYQETLTNSGQNHHY